MTRKQFALEENQAIIPSSSQAFIQIQTLRQSPGLRIY